MFIINKHHYLLTSLGCVYDVAINGKEESGFLGAVYDGIGMIC